MKLSSIKHVALILDGNRRWAKAKGLPTLIGHQKGLDAALKIARHSRKIGLHTLTYWAFSTENWNRSPVEIKYLMQLFMQTVDQYFKDAMKEQVRVIHLGRKDRLPKDLIAKINKLENTTKNHTKHVFNLALDYGGQDEILRAVKKINQASVKSEQLAKLVGKYQNKYPYYAFKDFLDTKDQPYPYPDVIIRTSGEQRLSGFMSWQCAYSELYFEKTPLPGLTVKKFEKILGSVEKRERRFGGN